ncbi:MAG: ADP-ribose polymerase [Bacteroidota bacterium]
MHTTAKAQRISKLIMVTSDNNNKFYDMQDLDNGTFEVTYGRVGNRPSIRHYPITQWDKKYREKVRKGYRDVTGLFAEVSNAVPAYAVSDPAVKRLMDDLERYANDAIAYHYTVSAGQVTQQQVDEAQALLDTLAAQVRLGMDANRFNQDLLAFYAVIPRKMANVRDHLVTALADSKALAQVRDQLGAEQDTLDVMAGQVKTQQAQTPNAPPQSLLDALGLRIERVQDDAEVEVIRRKMGDQGDLLRTVFRVENVRTRAAFDAHVAAARTSTVEQLWHGSRNANWRSILETGLVLRPANAVITGKMFGYGLYFADRCQKSLNYTSLRGSYWTGGTQDRGYLSLYDVHVGRQLTIKQHDASCYQLDEAELQARSPRFRAPYNSVFAHRGVDLRNNEYIVYNQAQCTVRYLIEVAR